MGENHCSQQHDNVTACNWGFQTRSSKVTVAGSVSRWEMEALMACELLLTTVDMGIGRQSHLLIAGQVLHPCRGGIMQHQPLELQQVKKRLKNVDKKDKYQCLKTVCTSTECQHNLVMTQKDCTFFPQTHLPFFSCLVEVSLQYNCVNDWRIVFGDRFTHLESPCPDL